MNLLINEPPLQVLPSLARKVGLNEAILLQQLHFRSLISSNLRDGHKWVYKTFEEWQEEFPFWSIKTIKRIVKKLEDEEYIFSTSKYNRMKMDRTKWYRINYPQCSTNKETEEVRIVSECPDAEGHNDSNVWDKVSPCHRDTMTPPITKEIKSIKKESVENNLDDVSFIINYLNKKTGKNFKESSSATQKLINGRLRDGHTLEDFQRVIDVKHKQWTNDLQFKNYLRPSTLFSPTNFENYLNENEQPKQKVNDRSTAVGVTRIPRAPQLDFSKGE